MAGSNFRVAKSPEAPKITIMHGSATRAGNREFPPGSTSVGDLLRAPLCFTSVSSTLVLDMKPFQILASSVTICVSTRGARPVVPRVAPMGGRRDEHKLRGVPSDAPKGGGR